MERGPGLAQSYHCGFCHNPDFSGRDNVPRLAAQREDYLVKALREYQSNTRPGYDASMAEVTQPISDAEILDLTYFMARAQSASSVALVGRPTFPDVALWDGVSASAMWSPWIIFRDGPLYFAASAPDLAT